MADINEPTVKRKRQYPEAAEDREEPHNVGQKKPRRSLRSSPAQEAPQHRRHIKLEDPLVSDEGGLLHTIQHSTREEGATRSISPLNSCPHTEHSLAAKEPNSRQNCQEQFQECELPPTCASPSCPFEKGQVSTHLAPKTIKEARIEFWSQNNTWPTQEQELTMDYFRQLINDDLALKRNLNRKRSNASLSSETTATQTTSTLSRDQKCAPYRHPHFERQLKEYGSFMDEHELGITKESEDICHQLLNKPQPVPEHTLFSDDELYKKTCRRLRGENETKVIQRISQYIIPSAEILADKGAKHLSDVRETTNACWVNSKPFITPPASGTGSRSFLRPQPDFGFGFDRDAFSMEQLQKLQPFLGDVVTDSSIFAATFQMYFPFLSCEVKCGDGGLDVADRQNAYTQSVILRGLSRLFWLVGRKKELHRKIGGFSLSHNENHVRIWGHYIIIDGKDAKFYRHPISDFIFAPTGEGDLRWRAYKFVKNVYDLWLPDHFKFICSAIDMLPADLDAGVADLAKLHSSIDENLEPSRSDLSQQIEGHSLADEAERSSAAQLATPETTAVDETEPNGSKTKKKKKKQ